MKHPEESKHRFLELLQTSRHGCYVEQQKNAGQSIFFLNIVVINVTLWLSHIVGLILSSLAGCFDSRSSATRNTSEFIPHMQTSCALSCLF